MSETHEARPAATSCSPAPPARSARPLLPDARRRRDARDDAGGDPPGRRRGAGEQGKVKLDVPPLVENGNTVALTVTVESPMTAADYVKAIHVFNEKNPQPNVISAHLGPRAGRARDLDPHPARRHADHRRHRRAERRLVLVGLGRRHRHARRLPGEPRLMARALINVPPKAKRGEIIEIKTLISHIMETGFRHDNVGQPIPRNIITSFICTYNGEEIFRADSIRRSPPIRSSPSTRSRPRAARSRSSGPATTASTRPARRRSPSNERRTCNRRLPRVASVACDHAACDAFAHCPPCCFAAVHLASPPTSRRTSAAPATPTWAARPRRCRTTTPPIPACCGCSTARRCGTPRRAAPTSPAPIATATPTQSMKGVAARYPAFDASAGRPVDLEQRINIVPRRAPAGAAAALREQGAAGAHRLSSAASRAACRSRRQTTRGSRRSSTPGRDAVQPRQGQLNLSCAQCHDDNWGKKLAGNIVPQGQPTGYPLYRLEWQSLGSLQRRLRNCMIGMRAEPYAYGAPEYVALELFLMWRARGMTIETPGVRP